MAWERLSSPDGGKGDIKTGANYYWTEEYSGVGTRLEVFYWKMPTDDPYLLDTRAPEELFLNPEDLDQFPNDIQSGEQEWTVLDQPED